MHGDYVWGALSLWFSTCVAVHVFAGMLLCVIYGLQLKRKARKISSTYKFLLKTRPMALGPEFHVAQLFLPWAGP